MLSPRAPPIAVLAAATAPPTVTYAVAHAPLATVHPGPPAPRSPSPRRTRRRALSLSAQGAPPGSQRTQAGTDRFPELDLVDGRSRAWFLREPDGVRRPGLPRADTPRPADNDRRGLTPPRTPSPARSSATGDKRDAEMRSPAARRTMVTRKRAKTSPAPRAQSLTPPAVPAEPRRSRSAHPSSASARLEEHHGDPVSPRNVPLPPSDDSFDGDGLDAFFAATDSEPDVGDDLLPPPAPEWLSAHRRGPRLDREDEPASDEPRGPIPRAFVPTPGSLAAQVAATNDVLPTAKDVFRFTSIPAEGPPPVHAGSPRWLFQNLRVQQIALWESIEGGKVFATIFGAGGADHLVDKALYATVASIRTELIRLTGIDALRVSPPDPENRPTTLNAPPYGFLVHGITDADALLLLEMGFLSTPKVSLLFFPFAVTFPTLMVSFMFISDRTNAEVRRMVVSLLRRPDIRSKVLDLVALDPAIDDQTTAHARARAIIKSTRIDNTPRSGKGGTPTPVFNVYVDTQAATIDDWKQWKGFFASVHWHDPAFGTLGIHDDVFCPGCRASDHYRWGCPFMAIPDWHGTMPRTSARGARTDGRLSRQAPLAGTRRRGAA